MGDEPKDEPTGSGDSDGDAQDLVDRDKIDFDPDDGLYSGTAVDGTTDIPGPHEGDTDDVDDDSDNGSSGDRADDGTKSG